MITVSVEGDIASLVSIEQIDAGVIAKIAQNPKTVKSLTEDMHIGIFIDTEKETLRIGRHVDPYKDIEKQCCDLKKTQACFVKKISEIQTTRKKSTQTPYLCAQSDNAIVVKMMSFKDLLQDPRFWSLLNLMKEYADENK